MSKQHICLWGPSGTGKTSLLGTFALWLYRKTNKKTRLYSGDGGGWSPIQHLVDAGIVEAWDFSRCAYPFETVRDATQGCWPRDLKDPFSERIPAWQVRYKGECGKCQKVVYDGAVQATTTVTCGICKLTVTVRPVRRMNEENGLLKVGLVCYEGLTAVGDMFMDNMSERAAKGEKTGGDTAVKFQDGEVFIASATQNHYGIAQRRVKAAVDESRHLPVDYVVWTALKSKGTDDVRRVQVFGPKLPGQAATDDVPRWFGPSLGTVNWPVGGKVEKRLYLTTYFETFNPMTKDIENVCNNRIPPVALHGVPDYKVFEATDETLLGDVVELIEARQAWAKERAVDGTKGTTAQGATK